MRSIRHKYIWFGSGAVAGAIAITLAFLDVPHVWLWQTGLFILAGVVTELFEKFV